VCNILRAPLLERYFCRSNNLSTYVYNNSSSSAKRTVDFVDIFLLWRCGPTLAMASSFLRFLDHKQRRTTFGITPLDERSAHRTDFNPTTHNTHNKQISLYLAGFEPVTPASERPQIYALDRAAIRTGFWRHSAGGKNSASFEAGGCNRLVGYFTEQYCNQEQRC